MHALGKDSSIGTHDPDKVIFNYSSHRLSNVEKNVLARGLNFALPQVKLNYGDYLTPFELLFRDVTKLPVPENILERLKVEIKREAFSSYDNYSFWDELNISKEEHKALKSLSTNKDLIIQKSGKGNSVVLLNRNDYIKRMNEMLSDSSKFKKLDIKPGKAINSLLQQEDRLTNFLKKVKRSISDKLYKGLYPRASQPGIMYGLSKIHKPIFNNFPKLRPILSAINAATYGWAKLFVPLLKCFTMNECTLKDSFEFAKDITNQNSNCFMASLDVDSLFTNVPLDETIKICIDKLFKSDMTVSGLNKKEMFEMLSLTLKESIILFDNKYYSQIDGVAMGSPLGPTLANIFLCYHESNWLKDCPKNFKAIYYKRYVHDIFVLFNKPERAQFFLEYINKKHKNIKFSIETELNGSLSFLDVKIFRENEKFVASVFRKDTFSGVYTNFISFISLEYKFGLVHTLLNRCFNLSSDFLKFHHEVDKLKKILSKNAYLQKFVDKCIQKFYNNMYIHGRIIEKD